MLSFKMDLKKQFYRFISFLLATSSGEENSHNLEDSYWELLSELIT
jgi:hypothetical protein